MTDRPVQASGDRSVAAGGNIHQVATGDFVTQIQHATVLPVEALDPTPVRNLPLRAVQFIGREDKLDALDHEFRGGSGVVVLYGLGGIGKSTLAAHWAATRMKHVQVCWWITAESLRDVDAGLTALGQALHPSLNGTLPDDALRARTVQWLAMNNSWLLILDNVTDPDDITPLLARIPSGRFLITSRRGLTTWRGIGTPAELGVLEPDEAVTLFQAVHGGSSEGTADLCAELGWLPLAVDQVAAYCREACIQPVAYQQLLARHPAEMYAMTPEGGESQRTVARVWQVTLDRLADTPAAMGVLRAIAWLAPEHIPRAFLEGLADPLEISEGLRRLSAYSMIKLSGDEISVHRLVQAVTRIAHQHHADGLRHFVVHWLHKFVSLDPYAQTAQLWATHVAAVARHAPAVADTRELSDLLIKAGISIARRDPELGLSMCERGIEGLRNCCQLAEGDPAIPVMALYLMLQGDSERALPLIRQQLSLIENRDGPDACSTFAWRHLFLLHLSEVDAAEAKALSRNALADAARELGPAHPLTVRFWLIVEELASPNPGITELDDRLKATLPVLGENDPSIAELQRRRLTILIAENELLAAVALAGTLVETYRSAIGGLEEATLDLRILHISLLAQVGKRRHARRLTTALWNEALQASRATPKDSSPLCYLLNAGLRQL